MEKFRIVELYAGTARSVEPFRHWLRAELALLVDSNPHARDTYLRNFPKAPYSCLNIEGLPSRILADLAGGRVDILLGCPPCQGFSESGARNKQDPRNRHVYEFARLAAELRPLAVAMENVPALGASQEFLQLTETLQEAGYRWTATIANAVQYGSCQSRQRLLFVALRSDLNKDPIFPAPTHGGDRKVFSYSALRYRDLRDDRTEMFGLAPSSQRVTRLMPVSHLETIGKQRALTLADVLKGLPPIGSSQAQQIQHERWPHSRVILRRMHRVPEGGKWCGSSDHYAHTYGRLHRRGFARTITTHFPYAGGGRFWHPTENRSLSLREAARIQGFSDQFQFLGSTKQSAVLVGNALDSALARLCYRVIRRALDD